MVQFDGLCASSNGISASDCKSLCGLGLNCTILYLISCLTRHVDASKAPNLMHKTHSQRVSESMADHSFKDVVRNTSSPHREGLCQMRKSFLAHQVMMQKKLPTDRRARRVSDIRDSRNLHQNIATRLRSQNSEDCGSSSVPTVISSFRSSLVSKLSGMESKRYETEQLTSGARYPKNYEVNNFIHTAASIPVRQQFTTRNFNEVEQDQPPCSDHDDLTYIKSRLLLRLSELRTSLSSACSRTSVFSNDYTMTGLYLEEESCQVASQEKKNEKEDSEISTKIRSICRDRTNYNLLVSAVLNISEHDEEDAESVDVEGEEDGESLEDQEDIFKDDQLLVSFVSKNGEKSMSSYFSIVSDEEEDLKASFVSSVSSLTKEQEYHSGIPRRQRQRRRKSNEFFGALASASVFTRKTKSNVKENPKSSKELIVDFDHRCRINSRAPQSNNPNGMIVDFCHRRIRSNDDIIFMSNLESRNFARDFSAWKGRETGRRKSSNI